MHIPLLFFFFFFFNDTATTEIYTLSLHDALPIYMSDEFFVAFEIGSQNFHQQIRLQLFHAADGLREMQRALDRKSTRLNSSHSQISYAVFCLKKKKKQPQYQNSVRRTHPETARAY